MKVISFIKNIELPDRWWKLLLVYLVGFFLLGFVRYMEIAGTWANVGWLGIRAVLTSSLFYGSVFSVLIVVNSYRFFGDKRPKLFHVFFIRNWLPGSSKLKNAGITLVKIYMFYILISKLFFDTLPLFESGLSFANVARVALIPLSCYLSLTFFSLVSWFVFPSRR